MKNAKLLGLAGVFALLISSTALSAPSQKPLFVGTGAPPLMMIVMQRDHKLYYEAYNDASDLDGDDVADIGYLGERSPRPITYLGIFDSSICYDYSTANARFEPKFKTSNKKCDGKTWSGDYLNYLTTSRMDALRVVLYGGYRSTDTSSLTVLERAYVPQDAHSWGKEYAPGAFKISDYTPFSDPASGKRHLFASTTLLGTDTPLLRVRINSSDRIWEWLSKERPVAGANCGKASSGFAESACTGTLTDYVVRVKACDPAVGFSAGTCKLYPAGNYKPSGLLHDYGSSDKIYFGLLSGSYAKNLSGGVLRKNIGSFTDEVNPNDGTFILKGAGNASITNTVDRLKITEFAGNYQYTCGWITDHALQSGECQMWGNPVAEMMYEAVRYYAGQTPTPEYSIASNKGEEAALSLPLPAWKDPYKSKAAGGGGFAQCAKPFMMVVSDVDPSYDSDELPGIYSGFIPPPPKPAFSGSLTLGTSALNVASETDAIWNAEFGTGQKKRVFIGQSGTISDSTPQAKDATNFSQLRGLAPNEPTKQGSYYAAGIAKFAREHDVSASADKQQNVQTFAVALASPLPRIVIPTSSGRKIVVSPFAKSVGGGGVSATSSFQPTNQLVDFYIDEIANTDSSNTKLSQNGGRPYYKFRVNYEDVEQGADHDMDAIATYTVSLTADNRVMVEVSSDYAAGGIVQHMGYVISGTTRDGVYLVVRDKDTVDTSDPKYPYNAIASTVAGQTDDPTKATFGGAPLPVLSKFIFSPSVSSVPDAEYIPHDPLWYAAKYGGYDKTASESGTGTPKSYFQVTNPALLKVQLDAAFKEIVDRTATSSTLLALNSGRVSSSLRVYQASFDSSKWTGGLAAYPVDPKTSVVKDTAVWTASIPNESTRNIITWELAPSTPAGTFTVRSPDFSTTASSKLSAAQLSALGVAAGTEANMVAYIRGDKTKEIAGGGAYRDRSSVLGDIVNSSPVLGGKIDFGFETLPASAGGSTYLAYLKSKITGPQTVYVGANDGMLHAFNADETASAGVERFAYVPTAVLPNLKLLADPTYTAFQSNHRYFVDGPLYYSDAYIKGTGSGTAWRSVLVGALGAGGQSIFALDVTNVTSMTSTRALWEFSSAQLGYVMNRPIVARMANGRWAVIVGNGPQSASDKAYLMVVYLEPSLTDGWSIGSDYCAIETDPTTGNGLGGAQVLLDTVGNAKLVYAGDLKGRLWKFDLSATSGDCPAGWAAKTLMTATNASGTPQPIVAAPEVTVGPNGNNMVVFGTGKYYEAADSADLTVQSLYGFLDDGASFDVVRSKLVQQEFQTQSTTTFSASSSSSTTREVKTVSQKPVDYSPGHDKGWVLDLLDFNDKGALVPKGERSIWTPTLSGQTIIFTTYVPGNDGECSGGGYSWLVALNPVTGGRTSSTFFDLNKDGLFNNSDDVSKDVASAVRFGFGAAPAEVRTTSGKYLLKPSDPNMAEGEKTDGTKDDIDPLGIRANRLMGTWRQIK